MNLTEKPEIVTWPQTHYVFVEKTGSIPQNAPLAWQEFHKLLPELKSHAETTGFLSLYKMNAQVYRAGVSVKGKPKQIPEGLRYESFPGGKYARFVLTGPYSQLGPATGRVVEIVKERKLPLCDDYHIEHYVNDPTSTPEEKLLTEILFPVK
jgi:effector-binding domain-containing protein